MCMCVCVIDCENPGWTRLARFSGSWQKLTQSFKTVYNSSATPLPPPSTWWSTLNSTLSSPPPKTQSRYTLVFISKWHAKIKHGSQRTEKQQCDVFRVKARTCSEVIRALGCYSTALIRSSKPCEINNAAAETGNQDCAACTNQSVLSRNSLHYTRLKRCYASNAPDTLKTFTAMHYSWHPGTW